MKIKDQAIIVQDLLESYKNSHQGRNSKCSQQILCLLIDLFAQTVIFFQSLGLLWVAPRNQVDMKHVLEFLAQGF